MVATRCSGCGSIENVTIIAANISSSAAQAARHRALAPARRRANSAIASSIAAAAPCQTECTSVHPSRCKSG
jgi:hypothetical protein